MIVHSLGRMDVSYFLTTFPFIWVVSIHMCVRAFVPPLVRAFVPPYAQGCDLSYTYNNHSDCL